MYHHTKNDFFKTPDGLNLFCYYDLDPLFTEFGSLAPLQLMEKVKELQNLAYQLGLEEG